MKTYREILEKQIETNNEGRGFHGVAFDRLNNTDGAAAQAFAKYVTMLSKHFKESPESMRDFLDSIAGRHFADSLSDDEMTGKKKPDFKSDKPLNKDMKIHLK